MKLFYAIILGLLVLVSACAQQPQAVQPAQPAGQPTAEQQEEGPAMEDKPGEAMEEKAGDAMEKATQAAAGDIRIVGKEGFDPMDMAINAGDAVTWVNDDKKALTLTIFKDGKWHSNSDVMQPGASFEQEFGEKGSYEFWTLAYGVKGKLTVQ